MKRLFFLAPLLLSACATSGVFEDGQPLVAPPEHGIGAISFTTTRQAFTIEMVSVDNTQQISLPHNAQGTTTHVFHAPPGVYCLESVRTTGVGFFFSGGGLCVKVEAGQSSYFGRIELDDEWKFAATYHWPEDKDAIQKRFGDVSFKQRGFASPNQ